MSPKALRTLSILSGLVLLVAFLVIAIFIPCPTSAQAIIFRIVLAIAAGAFAASMTGKITFKNDLLKATGGIAVFALVYLVNPAGWVTKDDCFGVKHFKGIVYIDDKEMQGVEVIVPSINRNAFTDGFGNFSIEYAESMINIPVTVRIRYKTLLDTSLSLKEMPPGKVEMRFSVDKKVSSTFSLSGSSVSFSNKDFNVVVSVRNTNFTSTDNSMFPDSVMYTPAMFADTLSVLPVSKYLTDFHQNQFLKSTHPGTEMGRFASPFPQFDVKVVNNSNDAIFLTEALLDVAKSSKDNRALLVMQDGAKELVISNAGWGSANNVSINYSLVPLKSNSKWNPNHTERINIGTLPTATVNVERSYFTLQLDNTLIKKGIDMQRYEQAVQELSVDNEPVRRQISGEFFNGGFVYGVINYQEDDGTARSIKFEASIDLWLEGGAAVEASAEYNTELKAEGKNYQVAIPISNGIKSKDFDRFFISMHAPQSSFHYFRLKLIYNNNEVFELPVVFKLHFFNTPADMDYVVKKNTIKKPL